MTKLFILEMKKIMEDSLKLRKELGAELFKKDNKIIFSVSQVT